MSKYFALAGISSLIQLNLRERVTFLCATKKLPKKCTTQAPWFMVEGRGN